MDNHTDFAALTVLGARGSIPVSGRAFSHYGGATTCFLLALNGQRIILDAGTGLRCLPQSYLEAETLPLFLTHPHVDHLLGLPMCPFLTKRGASLDLYAAERGGLSPAEQVGRLLSPPLWPVRPEKFPCTLRFHSLPEQLSLGGVRLDVMEGVHPGGVSLFRFTGAGKRVVLATDCTLTDELLPRVAEFARDCDLLLCDGQYSEEEWPERSGFGHSTWTRAAALGRLSRARQTRIVHHDPEHTDAMLSAAEAALRDLTPGCAFAREGETVLL